MSGVAIKAVAGLGMDRAMDPMAMGGETPDIATLQQELQWAFDQDGLAYDRIAVAENRRFARWEGQSPDGLKHRKLMGERTLPYEGAPDVRPTLIDGVCLANTDVLYAAFFGARVKFAPSSGRKLSVAEAAEARAMVSWILNGPLADDLTDEVEFAAYLQETLGWCVVHPSWRKESVLKQQRLTMEQVVEAAAEAASSQKSEVRSQNGGASPMGGGPSTPGFDAANPPVAQNAEVVQASGPDPADPAGAGLTADLVARAPGLIMDPATEEVAVELIRLVWPDLTKARAGRVVRELRRDGEAVFPVVAEGPNGPVLRVLVPGLDFVLPPESTVLKDRARWMPVREFMSEQRLRQLAQEEGWNAEWVERVCQTKGQSLEQPTPEAASDINMRDIEIFWLYSRQNDEDGVPGMYCTVFSMFVNPKGGEGTQPADYGSHELVRFAHEEYPFVFLMREVTGKRPMDSRGVPEMLHTQQNQQKNSLDLSYVREALTTVPPLQKSGVQASRVPPGLAPLGVVNNVSGAWKWFEVPPGNPLESLKLIELVQLMAEDVMGIANKASLPEKAMNRKQRMVMRWLRKWGKVLWQHLVLAYQNLSPEELTEILGRAPLLTVDLIAKQRLMLWFETRSMDGDWLDDMIENVIKLLGVDTGGVIDRAKLVEFILSYLDPVLGEEVSVDQAGAKQAAFKEVRDEINSMRLGNKPMLRENDPTAKMKLVFAHQVLGQNPEYQMAASEQLPGGQPNPKHDPQFAANLKTYLENLQHNYQEMVVSKQQGRLGVQDTGAGPVVEGGNSKIQ